MDMRRIQPLAALIALSVAVPGAAQETGRLLGVTFDSTRMDVLAGATVELAGTDYRTDADGRGRFFITGLPPGAYEVRVDHPRLDSLGVQVLRSEVVVRSGQTTPALVSVPSVERMLGAMCPERDSALGSIVGYARDGVTGVGLPDARVIIQSRGAGGVQPVLDRLGGPEERPLDGATTPLPVGVWARDDGLETKTDRFGRYVICGVPAGGTYVAQAQFLGMEGERIGVTVPPAGAAAQVLSVVITEPARIMGRIVDEQSGEPIVSATVELREERRGVITDADGRFIFPAVAPGSHTLVVTHVAYGETETVIEAVGGRTIDIDARLAQQVIELDEIRVVAEGYIARESRTRGTAIRALTRQEIMDASSQARTVGDLVRRIPGLVVTGGVGGPACVQSTTRSVSRPAGPGDPPGARVLGCDQIAVYVDDIRMTEVTSTGAAVGHFLQSLPVDDIESIEYLKPAEAALQYGPHAAQGVLLIYTLGNGPLAGRRR